MTAGNRLRNYLTNLNSRTKSSFGRASTADESNDGRGRNRSSATAAVVANSRTSSEQSRSIRPTRSSTAAARPRRRLQRGWWPDAQKRAERSFKAMEDLREETFVIADDNLEWIFDEQNEAMEPQCHLILPAEINSNNNTCKRPNNGRISNECAICMAEYDLGDVVIHSRTCCHAFHQDCILDWVSRENIDCPNCRSVFYDPNGNKKKHSSRLQNNGDCEDEPNDNGAHIIRRRSRSNTADTDTLSEYDGRRGTSFDGGENNDNNNNGSGLLEAVNENDAVGI